MQNPTGKVKKSEVAKNLTTFVLPFAEIARLILNAVELTKLKLQLCDSVGLQTILGRSELAGIAFETSLRIGFTSNL